jgi:hypothetical protein
MGRDGRTKTIKKILASHEVPVYRQHTPPPADMQGTVKGGINPNGECLSNKHPVVPEE